MRYYFLLKPSGLETETVCPDGSIDMEFQLEQGSRSIEKHTLHSRFSKPHTLTPVDLGLLLGVSFYPWALRAFIDFPVSEITNSKLPLSSVFGNQISGLQEKVVNAESTQAAIRFIELFLISKLKPISNHQLVASTSIQILKSGGLTSVKCLMQHASLSERRLEQCFSNTMGVSPKLYSRLTRFKKAKRLLTQKHESLTTVALESGYYDHSHFVHDFKKFAGVSPTTYIASQHVIDTINAGASLETEL